MVNTRGSDTNCKLQGIPHGGAMTIHARYHVLIMAQMFRVFVFSSCGLLCILLCNIYQHPKDDFFILIQNNSGISYGEPQVTI